MTANACTYTLTLIQNAFSLFLSPTIPGSPGVLAAGRAERESRAQSRDVQVLHKMTEAVHDPERRLAALPKKLMQRHESWLLVSPTQTNFVIQRETPPLHLF